MSYSGPERRKHHRVNARFIVSYRILNDIDSIDISQTKNRRNTKKHGLNPTQKPSRQSWR